ncbi:MAG: hypothetical protein HYU99_08765 [Deltaproteobacteria bacterium]|nr:hypothetical protein [Deltaproteobacteria bacterium]
MMQDNQTRIPSTRYLDPFAEALALFEEPASLEAACVDEGEQTKREQFVDIYEKATDEMVHLMHGSPIAGSKTFYPTSTTRPVVKKTGRAICVDDAEQLFSVVLESAQKKGPAGLDDALPMLHDAVYWANRAGFTDEKIRAELHEIREAYETWFQETPHSLLLAQIFSLPNLFQIVNRYRMDAVYRLGRLNPEEMETVLQGFYYVLSSGDNETQMKEFIGAASSRKEIIAALLKPQGNGRSCLDILEEEAVTLAASKNDPAFCLTPEKVKRRFALLRRDFVNDEAMGEIN